METWIDIGISLILLGLCQSLIFLASKGETFDEAEQYHSPEGCIPYREYQLFIRSAKTTHDSIKAPTWCNVKLLPDYLLSVLPQTYAVPFSVTTFQYNLSNAINVTIQSSGVGILIKDLYLTARSINPTTMEISGQVGRFVPQQNTKIVCCNYEDRNAIQFKPGESENASQVDITWLPNGDYIGPFVFLATIVNHEGKYWSTVRSSITQALD